MNALLLGQLTSMVHGGLFVTQCYTLCAYCCFLRQDALADPHMSGKPILLFGNKQDLPKALSSEQLTLSLGLTAMRNARHNVVPCTAKVAPGEAADPNILKGMR